MRRSIDPDGDSVIKLVQCVILDIRLLALVLYFV